MANSTKADSSKSGNKGNRNSLRHGLRSGKLPADCAWVEIRVNGFRRSLEDSVLESKGEITLTDAAIIRGVCESEKHHALAQRWLRKKGDKLKPLELLQFSKEIAKSAAEVSKEIAKLNLDRDSHEDVLAALYARSTAPKQITNESNGETDGPT